MKTQLDLLFQQQKLSVVANDSTDNASVEQNHYQSCLGAVFTVLAVVIFSLVGALLVLQNTSQLTPLTSITISNIFFQPRGMFLLNVSVVGFGLEIACTSSQLTLNIDDSTAFSGTPDLVVYEYVPSMAACNMTWQCRQCSLTGGKKTPSWTLQSSVGWAALYSYSFSTPMFLTSTGKPFLDQSVFSVSQSIFPADNVFQRAAFHASLATQQVILLLTAVSIIDKRSTPVLYATYQPSLLGVSKVVETVASMYALRRFIRLFEHICVGLLTAWFCFSTMQPQHQPH
jgi:hypothetical protein